MNAGTQQVLRVAEPAQKRNHSNGNLRTSMASREIVARVNGTAVAERKPRVFVAADNRLLREAISRMLVKSAEIEVVGPEFVEPFRAEDLLKQDADILILSSRGNANEDLAVVRRVQGSGFRVQFSVLSSWSFLFRFLSLNLG